MASTRFDVLGIGNAIVDVIARTEDDFLAKQKMRKGAMQLIDEAQAVGIYDAMGPAGGGSRGSAANTLVGGGRPRGRPGLLRKNKDDDLCRGVAHDNPAAGGALAHPP